MFARRNKSQTTKRRIRSLVPGNHSTGGGVRNVLEVNRQSTIRSRWARYFNLMANQVYGPSEGVAAKVSRQRGAKTNGTSIKFVRKDSGNGRKKPPCFRPRILSLPCKIPHRFYHTGTRGEGRPPMCKEKPYRVPLACCFWAMRRAGFHLCPQFKSLIYVLNLRP